MPPLPARAGIGLRHAHYAEVLGQRPALGFVEVHSENFFAEGGAALAVLGQAREHYDISLHGVGLALGSAVGVDDWHLDQLARLVERIEPIRVSDHASFARAPRAEGGPIVHGSDLLPIAFTPASLAILAGNVQRVQDRLRKPILVENLSAYIGFADQDALPEAEFLSRLCHQTGCRLLLDVNNLMVNALNAREARDQSPATGDASGEAALADCRSFIDALPPGSVGQLHLAGYAQGEHLVIDDHGSRVRPAVWALFRHAVARFGAVPTLIEWDTHLPPLATLLDEAALAQAVIDAHATSAQAPGHRSEPVAMPFLPQTSSGQTVAAQEIARETARQSGLMAALLAPKAPELLPVWAGSAERKARGLCAYRANLAAMAERAVLASFPTVSAMVGAEAIAGLAPQFWRAHPPTRGDLALWGEALPDYLASREDFAPWPYLPHVARLDWLRHVCEQAPEARVDADSLALLGEADTSQLRLHFMPGLAVLDTPWPIATLWAAHASPEGADGPDVQKARAALHNPVAEPVVVAREGWRAHHWVLSAPGDLCFTKAVLAGHALGEALDLAGAEFEFGAWLERAVRAQWLKEVVLRSLGPQLPRGGATIAGHAGRVQSQCTQRA